MVNVHPFIICLLVDNILKPLSKMPYDLLHRPRRLRENPILRDMLAENKITTKDLVLPVFVSDSITQPEAIQSMPEIFRWPLDTLSEQVKKWVDLGLKSFAVFPCISDCKKSEKGDEILNANSIIYLAANKIKSACGETLLISDIALDPYTTHGHDGILDNHGKVLNDETVEVLAKASVMAAEVGYDFVAPSDMMDGRVIAIRNSLYNAQYIHTGIMAYSAKFCSAYYGPFRDAIGTTQSKPIDKSSYQLNPSNTREAVRELLLDMQEGADILMVKPAEPYLDIIALARQECELPIAAYQVSGEYSRIWAAASQGWLDLDACAFESLLSIKRAGANIIISYFAERIAKSI